MTCRDCDAFLADYLSDELPADPRQRFERHLELCRNCREYLTQYADTIRAGRSVCTEGDADAPAEVPEALVRAILAARKG